MKVVTPLAKGVENSLMKIKTGDNGNNKNIEIRIKPL
jgi:hypothetical protein